MKPVPLRLALEPVLPTRTPSSGDCFAYGYTLRIPRGPALEHSDPLLRAFGAAVVWVDVDCGSYETIESDSFEPGRVGRLLPSGSDPDEPEAVGLWDKEGLRRAGDVDSEVAEIVAAAGAAGLEQHALVLLELRGRSDGRRERVCVLVHAPALVRVGAPRTAASRPTVVTVRPRLVLVANGTDSVRWWDPSATHGPTDGGELPMSQDLRDELLHLHDAFASAADNGLGPGEDAFERLGNEWERSELNAKALALWRRARAELGHRYTVGFLGAGMQHPRWSPSEIEDDGPEYADMPF